MALDTLNGLTEIDGCEVGRWDNDTQTVTVVKPIMLDLGSNVITFHLKDGPRGIGCDVDALVSVALNIISGFQQKIPCEQNQECLDALSAALNALKERKRDREKRNVEGTNQV